MVPGLLADNLNIASVFFPTSDMLTSNILLLVQHSDLRLELVVIFAAGKCYAWLRYLTSQISPLGC